MALGQSAQRAEWRGDYRLCIEQARRAGALAEQMNSPGDALFAQWFEGISAVCLGDYASGLEVLGRGIALCDRIGDTAIKARLLNTLGWAHAEFGSHERAAELNRSATRIAREAVDQGLVAGAPELYANGAINLANNLIALGRPDDAAEQLAPIQHQYETDPDPWMRWRWSVHLVHHQAKLALARGEPERALALARQAVEGAHATKARKLICRGHAQLGRVLLALDRREEAGQALADALAGASAIEYRAVAWQARSALAELARRRGDPRVADELIALIRDDFARLGPGLPDARLRSDFQGFGARLVGDPLGVAH
jgi:tetratricopeptide (TPR) repeat protein